MKLLSSACFVFFLFIATAHPHSSSSEEEEELEVSIQCTFSTVYHLYYEYEWTCTLYNNPGFIYQDMNITEIENESTNRRKAEDVGIFQAISRIVRYIPRRLEVLFPNLFGIRLENTQLKYITKDDLKAFPKLRLFISVLNQIEFIEKDLFINNAELEFVSFRSNQIKYIDPKVFDGLKKNLKHLWLDGTAIACGLRPAQTNAQVKDVLTALGKSNCVKIENAPAFYVILLKLQGNTCDTTDLDKCNEEKADAEATCNENIDAYEGKLTCFNNQLNQADLVNIITTCMNGTQTSSAPVPTTTTTTTTTTTAVPPQGTA